MGKLLVICIVVLFLCLGIMLFGLCSSAREVGLVVFIVVSYFSAVLFLGLLCYIVKKLVLR